MSFSLDTNVVSEARRSAGHAGVRARLRSVPAADLFVSVLLVGEIRRGVEQLRRCDRQPARVAAAPPGAPYCSRRRADGLID